MSYQDSFTPQVIEFVRQRGAVSIASIQRQYRIGYERAASIVEELEAVGVVSCPDEEGGRIVLRVSDHKVWVSTKNGRAIYYRIDDLYPDRKVLFVTFEDEEQEHELLIPSGQEPKPEYEIDLVRLFSSAYAAGKARGRYQKAKRLKDLFKQLQMEAFT